jgi:hypothetical protein
MHGDILSNKRMAILIVIVQLALLGGIVLYPNFALALVGIFSFVVAAAMWRFGYLLKPMITKQTNVVEGFGKYEIPPSQDVIVKKIGNRYYASSFMLVRFTQSSTEKTPAQVASIRQGYERALSSLNYVYKISNMVCPVELTPYIEKIKEKRSNAEARLSELSSLPSSSNVGSEMARLNREIQSYGSQLERIQAGERPMRVLNFAMTCASSNSRDDAISRTKAQCAEIKSVLSSTLDTEILLMRGDDMKRCFEWEQMLPDKDETDDYLF